MELKIFVRLGAVVLLAIAVVGAALEVRQNDRVTEPGLVHAAADLVTEELQRCSSLGTAAATDAVCRQAWAENRRRFFRHSSPAPQIPPAVVAPADSSGNSQSSVGAPQLSATPGAASSPDRGGD